mgnify:CR=1 FL=1
MIALALSLASIAEVSVFDWSSIYLREFIGIESGLNALGVSAFFVFQILGRTISGGLIDQYGTYKVVRSFALFSSIGYAIFLVVAWWLKTHENSVKSGVLLALSACAFGLVAFGASAMPATFVSAAGQIKGIPTARGITALLVRNSLGSIALRFVIASIVGVFGLTAALLTTAITLFSASLLSRVVDS